ncbi:helix-turn-helix transcriptional regulator [Methylobacterium sp. WL6]|uniref:helix-turn-helix domain-containing protein n=1 Tax=Methylobacterium sp. WL6 TaxID=2603901 RepID=UPI0011C9A22D|nr:helix-turn-helix transcriptional regulator [Methylobacterium sp. WL6]TXN72842.1 helix-turn-helix domain-containing protein [Methylobacterium sp. WL6]
MDPLFLRRLRNALGVSQTEFGRAIGLSQAQTSRALSGANRVKRRTAELAFALAEAHAPEIACEARLLDETAKALQESEKFRSLVRAALDLIHKNE